MLTVLLQWRSQRGTGSSGPLRNLRNFLSQIAWISSVKYRRCPGRRVLLVGYSSRVPITQRYKILAAPLLCYKCNDLKLGLASENCVP